MSYLFNNPVSQSGLLAFIFSFLFGSPFLFAQQPENKPQVTKHVVVVKNVDSTVIQDAQNPRQNRQIEVIITGDKVDGQNIGNGLQEPEDVDIELNGTVMSKTVKVEKVDNGTTKTITTVVKNKDGSLDTLVQEFTNVQTKGDDHTEELLWVPDNAEVLDSQDEDVEEHVVVITRDSDEEMDQKKMKIRIMIVDPDSEDLNAVQPANKVDSKNTTGNLQLEELRMFPNPNSGEFNLQFTAPKSKKLDVAVLDMSGKTVFKQTVKNFKGSYNNNIDISGYDKGTYILVVNNGEQQFTKKIIIQ